MVAVSDTLRKEALWLFGIMVGLALKEALTSVMPHLIDPPDGFRINHLEELWRLLVFIVLAVRFYFGSAVYFHEAYARIHPLPEGSKPDAEPANRYSDKSFGTDFIFGFFHFVLFAITSLTLVNHTISFGKHDVLRQFSFIGLICFILIYDVGWLLINKSNSTYHLIKQWAVLNMVTVMATVSIFTGYFVVCTIFAIPFNFFAAEALALLAVFIASSVDIIELIMGKTIFAKMLRGAGESLVSLSSE